MPVQSSQDLDARFAVFLNPIRDLTKNWEVDIAKYLEEYLVELSEIQITFDGGETTMNFAEAAMLIQGSATVYSKKVEFLWQMVLQMLDLLSSKRAIESRTENSKVGEGGRHKQVDLFIEFEKVEKLCDGKTINMKDDEEAEEEEMKNSFKFLPEMPLHLVEKESEKSLMKIVLYLKNMETFGNKDDFRINRSYLTPSGLLYLDLPPEILKKQMYAEKIIAPSADDSIAGFLNNVDENLATQNILIGTEKNVALPQEEMEDLVDNDYFDSAEPDNELPSSHETSPLNVESGIVDELNQLIQDDNCEKLVTVCSGNYGLRSRNAPKEVVAKVKLSEPLKPLDPHVETPAKRPIRAGRIRKPLPCMCHREQNKAKRNRISKDDVSLGKGEKILPSVESFITRDLANLISNNNNDIKIKVVDSRLLEELTSEETKRQENFRKKKVKELLNNEQELTSEEIKLRLLEEAQQQNKAADRMADEIYDDHIPDLDIEDLGGGDDNDDMAMPDPHDNNAFDDFDRLSSSVHNRNLNDSALYEPGSDYEALVQKWVSDYVASAQEHIASSELTRRVNKWRKIITPKLQEEEERQAFDIHSYGSHIIAHFPENYTGNISFGEVANGKSSNEVARLFLSCLMLANTYNIELSQTRKGDLEMDCLQLKLLSKVRHHKEMEENLPPSAKKKKSKQDKRKKQVSSDDEIAAVNPIPVNEYSSVATTNKNLKYKNPKKLKVAEKNSNI